MRTCSLRQATVEYDVRFTNNSIALRVTSDSLNDTSSAGDTNTSATTNSSIPGSGGAAAPWQPKQDRLVADTPERLIGNSPWAMLSRLLVPPVQVNLTHYAHSDSLRFWRYVDCGGADFQTWPVDAGRCLSNNVVRRDMALEYVINPYNLNAVPLYQSFEETPRVLKSSVFS
jgi:hypothetical protein